MVHISGDTKSRVVLSMLKNEPNLLSTESIRNMAVDSKNPTFSFEDASEAMSIVSESEKKGVSDNMDSTMLSKLFPNAKLEAELQICADVDRTKYDDFTEAVFKLNEIISSIDKDFGSTVDFLLDEIEQNANIEAVDKIRNQQVSIINVENS